MTTRPASTTSTERRAVCRVGFIGLGDQGAPIAERILRAGFPVQVWARRAASVASLAELGAGVCAGVTELGQACDVVGLCVSDDADVREIVFDRGLLDSMAAGSILLVHSTVAPATCREIAAAAGGVHVLDAPVSGGRTGAMRGTLSVVVGGDADALARARPVLDTYAGSVRHLGPVGSGQAAKLINNGLFVANVAMAELAVQLGVRIGLPRAELVELLAVSSGASTGLSALDALTTTEWGAHAWSVLAKDVELLASLPPGDGAAALVDVAVAAVTKLRP